MDLLKLIADLRADKAKLENVIMSLEELAGIAGTSIAAGEQRGRCGRKFMGAAERKEVAARMKRYWAKRRHLTEK